MSVHQLYNEWSEYSRMVDDLATRDASRLIKFPIDAANVIKAIDNMTHAALKHPSQLQSDEELMSVMLGLLDQYSTQFVYYPQLFQHVKTNVANLKQSLALL